MKISVIGCGYLGAVHAVSMAKLGHIVTAIDTDPTKIRLLSEGTAPFFEPGFENLLAAVNASGRITFSTDISLVDDSEVHFVAVGTPQSPTGVAADLSHVFSALDSLIPHLQEGSLIAGKSTVPVGTAAVIARKLAQVAPQASLVWNPEFLREGFAIEDTLRPDRIVYGVSKDVSGEHATKQLDRVYSEILERGTPRLITDFATAELVKVAANSFLATKISFINAMAEISEVVGADVTVLADAIGHDQRIGRKFLNAGVGFGGGCLPKDIRAFAARADELGVTSVAALLHEVDDINLRRRERVIALATEALGGSVEGRRITVLGASFKPNSDDVRDSPALEIAANLAALRAEVTVTDPQAIENARMKYPGLRFAESTDEAVRGAELLLLLTEWDEYKDLNPTEVHAQMSAAVGRPTIIDGRNCLDPEQWEAANWRYQGMGR